MSHELFSCHVSIDTEQHRPAAANSPEVLRKPCRTSLVDPTVCELHAEFANSRAGVYPQMGSAKKRPISAVARGGKMGGGRTSCSATARCCLVAFLTFPVLEPTGAFAQIGE